MLTPVLALITWSLIVWVWMYATRIPAMQDAKMNPDEAIHPGSLNSLPSNVRVVADNYNHLHEQPTIFYGLVFYSHLAGTTGGLLVGLAWTYVCLRVVHSIAQIVVKSVPVRFGVFALSSLVLVAMAILNLLAL